jgi:predicted lipid-binding transport protein (Tim44 family)
MRPPLLAAVLLLTAGCGLVKIGPAKPLRQSVAEQELRGYYAQVQQAFARADETALTELFDPAITKPMTRAQIRAWAKEFFTKHGRSRFVIEDLELVDLGPGRAVARLRFRVVTSGGKGDFAGAEMDVLEKRAGLWRVTGWEKVEGPKDLPAP